MREFPHTFFGVLLPGFVAAVSQCAIFGLGAYLAAGPCRGLSEAFNAAAESVPLLSGRSLLSRAFQLVVGDQAPEIPRQVRITYIYIYTCTSLFDALGCAYVCVSVGVGALLWLEGKTK